MAVKREVGIVIPKTKLFLTAQWSKELTYFLSPKNRNIKDLKPRQWPNSLEIKPILHLAFTWRWAFSILQRNWPSEPALLHCSKRCRKCWSILSFQRAFIIFRPFNLGCSMNLFLCRLQMHKLLAQPRLNLIAIFFSLFGIWQGSLPKWTRKTHELKGPEQKSLEPGLLVVPVARWAGVI